MKKSKNKWRIFWLDVKDELKWRSTHKYLIRWAVEWREYTTYVYPSYFSTKKAAIEFKKAVSEYEKTQSALIWKRKLFTDRFYLM